MTLTSAYMLKGVGQRLKSNAVSGCLLPQVNAKASQVECAVQGLLLDELELASLRGEVQEALLSLNLESRLGRAVVSIAGPRFSGLQGQSLSGAFRWERGRCAARAGCPSAGQLQVRIFPHPPVSPVYITGVSRS